MGEGPGVSSSIGAFVAAMRRMVSGVTVVTTRHDGRPWGMTVNAFSSVCAEPPTVLVCVNNRTATAADIRRDGRFAVNLLSQDQLFVSRLCAKPGQVKYLDDHTVSPDELPAGVTMPVLRDSLATFDCVVGEARPVGTHLVVIGTVEAIITPPSRTPLLYGQGRYLHGVAISESPAMLGAMAWA
ncbi:MAG TPA: flavin reductase family protein [Mycobacteriales bacterium]